jgi:hypothetical protein
MVTTDRLPLISDVGNLRLFEGSSDLEVPTSAAAETALLLGLVAIIAAPFSVMHDAVQFCAWSGELGRKRPCHGEPVPIDLRFQLHQATHLEADHLGVLVADDQQRGKPAEERHVADKRKRLLGLSSKPLRDRCHRVIRRKTRSRLDARLHADLPHKQLRGLLCAQLSAVQAAADPNVRSPGSLSDTLHRRSTGIREGSLWILCFGRRLTVLHQVQVHVGHLRWFHHHPADARS